MQDYLNIDDIEVGIDEAGLGCVAGSFFVSAVILPKKCPNLEHSKLWNNIKDSKKLSEKGFSIEIILSLSPDKIIVGQFIFFAEFIPLE